MVITYHGEGFFRLQHGSTVLALGPANKSASQKSGGFGADIALIAVCGDVQEGSATVTRGGKQPFVISGPGEYEVRDIFVRGFDTQTNYNGCTHNTVYLIAMENMMLCYAGALSTLDLPKELDEAIEDIDIFFVPLGEAMLSPKDAHKLGVRLEPNIIVPMYYTQPTLKTFLKEEGSSNGVPIEKLTVKPKDAAGMSGSIIVLDSK